MSFVEILKIHENLNELFPLHQESLLRLDLELAAERLRIIDLPLLRRQLAIGVTSL